MSPAELSAIIEESGAVLRGHFVLTSGRHSDVYFEKFRILENPIALAGLCSSIAKRFRSEADLVAGPTTGGIIVAYEVARQLGIRAVYVESEGGVRKLRRGARLEKGARVLVVDDVLTTGKSVQETIDAVAAAGGVVLGVGVLVDRSEEAPTFKCPCREGVIEPFAAFRFEARSYAPGEVPDWLAAIPAAKPGTGIELRP
jgi:orotate phosphoribosyltransferase